MCMYGCHTYYIESNDYGRDHKNYKYSLICIIKYFMAAKKKAVKKVAKKAVKKAVKKVAKKAAKKSAKRA